MLNVIQSFHVNKRAYVMTWVLRTCTSQKHAHTHTFKSYDLLLNIVSQCVDHVIFYYLFAYFILVEDAIIAIFEHCWCWSLYPVESLKHPLSSQYANLRLCVCPINNRIKLMMLINMTGTTNVYSNVPIIFEMRTSKLLWVVWTVNTHTHTHYTQWRDKNKWRCAI